MTKPSTRPPVRFPVLAAVGLAALAGLIALRGREKADRARSEQAIAETSSNAPASPIATSNDPHAPAARGDAAAMPSDGAPAPTQTTPPPAAESETEGMVRLRTLVRTDPERAVTLAAELDGRSASDSPHAEERSALAIDALVNLGKIGKARSRAVEHYRRFPAGAHAEHIEQLTGAHPRPASPDAPAPFRPRGDRPQ